MSKPLKLEETREKKISSCIQHVMCGVIDAESALNMYPEPLPEPEGKHLSETDGWAKHCMEHLRQIFADLMIIQKMAEDAEYLEFKRELERFKKL